MLTLKRSIRPGRPFPSGRYMKHIEFHFDMGVFIAHVVNSCKADFKSVSCIALPQHFFCHLVPLFLFPSEVCPLEDEIPSPVYLQNKWDARALFSFSLCG